MTQQMMHQMTDQRKHMTQARKSVRLACGLSEVTGGACCLTPKLF